MKVRNVIAAICGVIVIACMASGLPVFAAETDEVVYVDVDGDGKISDAEREYAHALKMVQDFNETYDAVMADYNALVEAQAAAQAAQAEDAQVEEEIAAIEESGSAGDTTETTTQTTTTSSWDGRRLTKSAGSVMGPSGKEVYYNLNMSKVVENAQRRGLQGSYWVRSDGVKMFGDYIIVAANYNVHPYGSTFEISLGTAIALDTGGFASSNPTMVDVAVTW